MLPVALLVVGGNYFIDPANLFGSKNYVSNIADLLVRGNNADNISNYDERLLQLELTKRIETTPDIVVLGSSRIMEIGSEFFPGKIVRNMGVSHANIYDIVSVMGILDSLGHLPSEIYLNVDPGLFELEATTEWQSIEPFYDHMANRYRVGKASRQSLTYTAFKKKLTLFSFEYFQEALQFKWKGGTKKIIDAGKAKPTSYGRYADGSIAYPSSYINPDTVVVAKIAVDQVVEKNKYEMDPAKEKVFDELLQFFKAKKIKVHFVMIPFHPFYLKAMNEKFDQIFSFYENQFRAVAASSGIEVIGSFNGSSYALTNPFFYDSFHCSLEGIQKIFKSN